MAADWDRVMKRLGLVLAGKTYCYECLCEPGAGVSMNGFAVWPDRHYQVDLCFPCWEPYVIDHTVPDPAAHIWWQRLSDLVDYVVYFGRALAHRTFHVHDWENMGAEGWLCSGCEAMARPTPWPLPWNPLAQHHRP